MAAFQVHKEEGKPKLNTRNWRMYVYIPQNKSVSSGAVLSDHPVTASLFRTVARGVMECAVEKEGLRLPGAARGERSTPPS